MTIEKYRDLALRTKKENMEVNDIELGLIGEFGELVDIIKKIKYHNHSVSDMKDKLKKEIGDFLWYFVVYCDVYGYKYNVIDRQEDSVMFNIKYIFHNLDKLLLSPFSEICDINGVYSSILQIIDYYGLSLTEILEENIQKLQKRYPDKYSDYNSINRSE